jgi:curved DNA-binding protein CbpA
MCEFLLYLLSLFGCIIPVSKKKDMPNLYDVLEVSEDATNTEIRRAYLRLAKTNHPDKNLGSLVATAEFQRITDAYHRLSTPETRKMYDDEQQEMITYEWKCACCNHASD